MNTDDDNGGEYWPQAVLVPIMRPYRIVPLGKEKTFGVVDSTSDPNNGFLRCWPFSWPIGRIPYHFPAGQGNEWNLKKGDEVEFDFVNSNQRSGYEATNIERLRPGTLLYEFSQDRDQGTIMKMAVAGMAGKIEYRVNPDTCAYCDFQEEDIIDLKSLRKGDNSTPETIKKGSKVKFFYVKIKPKSETRPISHVAKFIVPSGAERMRGQVCTLKSGYGFIKRLNVDKEIFFHVTEIENDPSIQHTAIGPKERQAVKIGDKVDFSISYHDNREVASQIVVLPKNFPMEFDDLEHDMSGRIIEYQGTIIRPCDKKNLSQPQVGLIAVDDFVKEKIEYQERDRQNSFTLIANDLVTFNKAIDKRSGKERAINIRLRFDKSTDADSKLHHKRERGIVAAVKGSYGFIKRDRIKRDQNAKGGKPNPHNESRIFFHSSEILNDSAKAGRRRIKMGDEVEYTVLEDPIPKSNQKGKMHATRIIRKATKYDKPKDKKVDYDGDTVDTVRIEKEVSAMNIDFNMEPMYGYIENVAQNGYQGAIRLENHMGSGEGHGVSSLVLYEPVEPNEMGHPGLNELNRDDFVKFELTRNESNEVVAVNIRKRYTGRVKLKDNYGFLIYEGPSEPCLQNGEEVFFHSSDVNDFDQFEEGDTAEFCIIYKPHSGNFNASDIVTKTKRHQRRSLH